MEHDEMYEVVCGKRFDKIDETQKEIINLLRGKNNSPGLVDDVRGLKKAYRSIIAAVIFIVCLVVTEVVPWVKEIIFGK